MNQATNCLILLEQPDLRMAYEGKTDPFERGPPPPMFPNALGLVVVRVPPENVGQGGLSTWSPKVRASYM